MEQAEPPRLLAIVGVPSEERVLCGQPGCGHGVYAEIHVVQDAGKLLVLGSTCFARRYGSRKALGGASFGGGGGGGRQLTPEERLLLVENTEELLARFENERLRAVELARAQAEAARLAVPPRAHRPSFPAAPFQWSAPSTGPTAKSVGPVPWKWMKPGTSFGYFKLNDGTGWVRVQRNDGKQMLAPWPMFDGWYEALPAHIGPADLDFGAYALRDVVAAVEYLRRQSVREKVSGVWRDIVAAAS